MDSYKKLRAENDARYRQMSELIEKANQAGGDLSADDTKTFDSLDAEYRRVQGVIEKNHQLMALAAKDREAGFVDVGPDAPEVRRAPAARETAQRAPRFGDFRCSDEYVKAYETYLKRGEHTPVAEMRALSEGTAGSGDVLPPTEFHNELAKRLQNIVAIRKLARVLPLGSWKREIAFETALPSASFVSEGGSVASEGGSTFANRVLQPRRLAGLALVSNELIEDAPARGPGFSIESILTEQFARKFGEVEESNFLVGNGTAPNPKGILTYTSGTNTTVSTGSTMGGNVAAPALTAANVIDWVYSIPRQYRMHPSCAIVTSDVVLGMIRKLGSVGGTVSYFWQPSGMLGEPDRIMGIPVYASAYVNSISAGSVIGIAGAFDYCVIGERSGYQMKVLRERYAETNQTGYFVQSRVDVTLTQTEAFTYLKSPAS